MTVYVHPEHLQFVQDMQAAGFEPFHHQGPFFWQGPAVSVGDPTDVLSRTDILCQWQYVAHDGTKLEDSWIFFGQRNDMHEKCKAKDHLPGYVVYPVQGMESPDPDKHRHIKPTETV